MGQTTKAIALGLLMAGLAGVAGANDYIGPDGTFCYLRPIGLMLLVK